MSMEEFKTKKQDFQEFKSQVNISFKNNKMDGVESNNKDSNVSEILSELFYILGNSIDEIVNIKKCEDIDESRLNMQIRLFQDTTKKIEQILDMKGFYYEKPIFGTKYSDYKLDISTEENEEKITISNILNKYQQQFLNTIKYSSYVSDDKEKVM